MSLHLYIYCCCIYIKKQRKKEKKMCQLCRVLMQKHSAKWPSHVSRTSTLPSAKVLALSKDLNVCRVPGPSTRQSDHVAGPWWPFCRVPTVRHSAKIWKFAECPKSDTRQRTLCRGRFCRVAFAECYTRQRVCRVQTGLLPSVTGTRQSQWIRSCINLA